MNSYSKQGALAVSQVNNVNPEAVLQEKLALQRLKRVAAKPPDRWPAVRSLLWRAVRWPLGLLAPVELVQLVGPDQRPLRRHEWERRDPYRPFS